MLVFNWFSFDKEDRTKGELPGEHLLAMLYILSQDARNPNDWACNSGVNRCETQKSFVNKSASFGNFDSFRFFFQFLELPISLYQESVNLLITPESIRIKIRS